MKEETLYQKLIQSIQNEGNWGKNDWAKKKFFQDLGELEMAISTMKMMWGVDVKWEFHIPEPIKGRGYGQGAVAEIDKKLTQEEVDALPIGAEVIIIWTGGNGPHEYTIEDKLDNKPLTKKFNPNAGWDYGQIEFVGDDKPHTVVWLKSLPPHHV